MSNLVNPPTDPDGFELHVAMTARRATVNFKQARSQSWQLDGVDTPQQWPARRSSEPTITAAKDHAHDQSCVPTHSGPVTRPRRGSRGDRPAPTSPRAANAGPSNCRWRSHTSTSMTPSDPSSPSSSSKPPPSNGILNPLPLLRYPRALPALEKVLVEYALSFPPLPPTPVAARFVASALASDPFHKLITQYGHLLAAPPSSRMEALELLLSAASSLPEAEGAKLSRMVIAAYEDIDKTASPYQHQVEWSDSDSDSSSDEDDLWHDPTSQQGADTVQENDYDERSDSDSDDEAEADKRKGKGKEAEGRRPAIEEDRRPCPCGGGCGAICTYEMRVGGIPRPPKRQTLRKVKSAVIPPPGGGIARRRGMSIVRLAEETIHDANQARHRHGYGATPPSSGNGLKFATSPEPQLKHEPQHRSRMPRRPSLAALSTLSMGLSNRSWVAHSPAGISPVSGDFGSSSSAGRSAPHSASSLGPSSAAFGPYSMTGASASTSSSSSSGLYGVPPTQAIDMFDSFLAARERERAARIEEKWGIRIGEEPFNYAQQFEAQEREEREKEDKKKKGWFRRKSEAEADEPEGGKWFRRRASEADQVQHGLHPEGRFTIPRPKTKRLGLRRKTVGEDETHSIPVTPTATSHNTPTVLSPASTPSFAFPTRPRAKTVVFADQMDHLEEKGRLGPRPAKDPHEAVGDDVHGYASDDSEDGMPHEKYTSSGSWDEDEIRAHLGELHLGVEPPAGPEPKKKWKFGRK